MGLCHILPDQYWCVLCYIVGCCTYIQSGAHSMYSNRLYTALHVTLRYARMELLIADWLTPRVNCAHASIVYCLLSAACRLLPAACCLLSAAGTGMRASVLLALPKLANSGGVKGVEAVAKPLGLAVRGLVSAAQRSAAQRSAAQRSTAQHSFA